MFCGAIMKNIISNIDEIEKFSNVILNIVERDKIDYMDAILEYCEQVDLEIDVAAKLISPFIKSKISQEAKRNNLIQKGYSLNL